MDDRLYRSEDDRVIAGVAGGLAERWDSDPALVRLLWVLLAIFTGGMALIVYVIMAIVVPDESVVYPGGRPTAPSPGTQVAPDGTPVPLTRAEARRARIAARRAARNGRDGRRGLAIGGSVLIMLGAWFLLREFVPIDFDWVWPAMLIASGILIVVFALDRRSERPGGAA
jgi:phage shock protein PspC (stress-responsive transcriptional regulator)